MVDPSPPISLADEKAALRREFRAARKAHVEALPHNLRALILNRPPAPVAAMISEGATVGLYYPVGAEAPALGWVRWLAENGRTVALPAFTDRDSAMTFRIWDDAFDEESLEPSPWGGALQPGVEAEEVVPSAVVIPLVAFTAAGTRLGQGGGHYDRWLAEHPDVLAIGLAWDVQQAEALPVEPHDRALAAIVTPTRIHEPAPATSASEEA
ncbi:5-formyltetrahydrofolate cyclo-ligase [Novosphingobium sp. 9]|uniref:5-formyltetrahydrofolate cyclo-ligase n=1 Tax=Novosphingobium sp. 9 TaxID=2025349 RepID=UPI0021B5FB2A|nr:5-formyltetrahydrofolate cyclo-ligase [Novosphingobium sp. 9]